MFIDWVTFVGFVAHIYGRNKNRFRSSGACVLTFTINISPRRSLDVLIVYRSIISKIDFFAGLACSFGAPPPYSPKRSSRLP